MAWFELSLLDSHDVAMDSENVLNSLLVAERPEFSFTALEVKKKKKEKKKKSLHIEAAKVQ